MFWKPPAVSLLRYIDTFGAGNKLSHKIADNGTFISNVSINNKIRAVKQRSRCRVGRR